MNGIHGHKPYGTPKYDIGFCDGEPMQKYYYKVTNKKKRGSASKKRAKKALKAFERRRNKVLNFSSEEV